MAVNVLFEIGDEIDQLGFAESLAPDRPLTGREMSGWTQHVAKLRKSSNVDFTLHDLRRTMRSGLTRLEVDHDYLTEGGVFTEDLIETWIEYKRTREIDPIRLRPHPHEFELYYDI